MLRRNAISMFKRKSNFCLIVNISAIKTHFHNQFLFFSAKISIVTQNENSFFREVKVLKGFSGSTADMLMPSRDTLHFFRIYFSRNISIPLI